MKRTLLVCLIATPFVFAEVPDTTGPGWTALFKPDYSDVEKPDGVWSVADGAVSASADQAMWTQAEHSDFMLYLEFKNAAGTNSGVVLYCTDSLHQLRKYESHHEKLSPHLDLFRTAGAHPFRFPA